MIVGPTFDKRCRRTLLKSVSSVGDKMLLTLKNVGKAAVKDIFSCGWCAANQEEIDGAAENGPHCSPKWLCMVRIHYRPCRYSIGEHECKNFQPIANSLVNALGRWFNVLSSFCARALLSMLRRWRTDAKCVHCRYTRGYVSMIVWLPCRSTRSVLCSQDEVPMTDHNAMSFWIKRGDAQ